jgi:phosphatidylinositol 4-kinase
VLSPEEITPFLKALAILMSKIPPLMELQDGMEEYEDVFPLLRDTWFNIAAHDISFGSEIGKEYRNELRIIAEHSPPLVAENGFDMLESDIELNTVLRRGASSPRAQEKKKTLSRELTMPESDVRKLSYPKSVFLNAALLIESLRSAGGDCTKVFAYFLDPALGSPDMANCMKAVVEKAVAIYLDKALAARSARFSAPYMAIRLSETFITCCHRIEKVQQVAAAAASRIVSQCPSALCERRSLFALLDLLTLLWSACLDEELDEFEWKSTFTRGTDSVKIELPDNYDFRRRTLNHFHNLARAWISVAMNVAPLDVKGLLQVRLTPFCIYD